jgi:putative (di)nucleoside polyphosphate hydrolase
MYRELQEETGLEQSHVRLVAHTKEWLHYDLPRKFLRNQGRRMRGPGRKRINFKGQKQIWFLLELLHDDSVVNLAAGLETPEFDRWRWVDKHHAIDNIVDFKRGVYQQALTELGCFLPATSP